VEWHPAGLISYGNFGFHMKNLVIDNHGLQSQNKNQNKTKLERKIEQLKTSEQQLTKQLKL